MKNKFIWLAKALVAGLLAFSVVSGISFFCYNIPTHYTNKTGATDYYLNKNQKSFVATEGFAYTQTDENGFVNTYPEKKDEIDILIMGSSHTESLNVNYNENFIYLLNEKLNENNQEKYAYSIGVSAHNFIRCLRNFDNAVAEYRPRDYVIIETLTIEFIEEELEQLNAGTYPELKSYDSGLMYNLQKVDFLRLAYSQITNFIEKDKKDKSSKNKDDNKKSEVENDDLSGYQNLLEHAISQMSKTAEKNGVKVIVVYSPQIDVDYNGDIIKGGYTDKQKMFFDICEKYDIECIDMLPSYEAMYKESRHLPQGFSNMAIGKGHANKYGHKCIADELYKIVAKG